MSHAEHHVYIDSDVFTRYGVSVHQLIEAGLRHFHVPFDSDTFEVDYTGNEV